MSLEELRIAAIIPCHNEELTVATVVGDLRKALPAAEIYVYDNNSTDRTSEVAAEAGAIVRYEKRKGKGNVVRRAFADIEADVYLMIDGDDTYDASAAPRLIETLVSGPLDHVVGVRVDTNEDGSYRPGHAMGNKVFNSLTSKLFGEPVTDMLSGYRAFSRRYIKSFPANSQEFEIETELTIHAANLRVPQAEVPIGFKDRPEGSESKLRTFRDGFKILGLLAHLMLHERPLLVCGLFGLLSALVSLVLGVPVIADYLDTGQVERFPTAFLSSSLMVLAFLAVGIGMVMNAVMRATRETRRLFYLQLSA
ncbi:glycosyltransferase [Nocardioides dongxiaopingii]|jgi:glycosyltransferase involved in cell wall biosynthesis|uniref:glycosyltransferase n=1 Tax=Nocardioides TaxID=1839 RepID=UPI0010C76709|nr:MULTISPECIES: glycosyltransferase [Nocardioides]QCW52032.1 glycosyltransferase [Nocardioides sp. S-1144]